MIPLLPGFLQVGEERVAHQLVLRHPLGEGWQVAHVAVGLDQLVVVVEADHGVLRVPGHVDDLGSVKEVGWEEGEGQVGLYKPSLVHVLQELHTVPVTCPETLQCDSCPTVDSEILAQP